MNDKQNHLTGTMIENIVRIADEDPDNSAWHFRYQPRNGGPIVSLAYLNHGPDFVLLDLEGSDIPFFVHIDQMAWAAIDWHCETMKPYLGHNEGSK